MGEWFCINNINGFDSPLLAVYPERVRQNIQLAIEMLDGDIDRLRPHVKTNKMAEVCVMMMQAGISKFKCATIAEAEMLGIIGAADVLLAYQPVGPKIERFVALIDSYPKTQYSCLVDNTETAQQLSDIAASHNIRIAVFIDINIGMNRTGIQPEYVIELAKGISRMNSIILRGLHGYDGHIRDSDLNVRRQKSEATFGDILALQEQLFTIITHQPAIVAGGTPTFPVHLHHAGVECSPGTFVFSDWGYKHSLPDELFEYAALVITRVVSVIDEETICVDLGHKSVAAENPLPRVHFLNAQDAQPVSQSEEHLVLKVPSKNRYRIGDVFYGVPVHICPTVALYDKAYVVEDENITNSWQVIARNRSLII